MLFIKTILLFLLKPFQFYLEYLSISPHPVDKTQIKAFLPSQMVEFTVIVSYKLAI